MDILRGAIILPTTIRLFPLFEFKEKSHSSQCSDVSQITVSFIGMTEVCSCFVRVLF